MTSLAERIGAKVLSVSRQDYDPQGASVTFSSRELHDPVGGGRRGGPSGQEPTWTVHTYPEYHPETSIATFRVDVGCGDLRRDHAAFHARLPHRQLRLRHHHMDYRVRGFTGTWAGEALSSTTRSGPFRTTSTLRRCGGTTRVDINVYQANLFHTRC